MFHPELKPSKHLKLSKKLLTEGQFDSKGNLIKNPYNDNLIKDIQAELNSL